jgi:hypothetical protein
MGEHYSVAWMDRWLKKVGEPGYGDADARLLADADWCARYSFYFRAARWFPDRAGTLHTTEDVRADCLAGVVDPPAPCSGGPLPDASCRSSIAPGGAQLTVKNKAGGKSDQLKWKWGKGAATDVADFGDPVNGGTDYQLCVFDHDGDAVRVAAAITIPAGGTCAGKPCWRATPKGFQFGDPTLANQGVKSVKLRSGSAGAAGVSLQAKGADLALPSEFLPFAQSPRVTVQLTNDLGRCWTAGYAAPAKANRSGLFTDRGE